MKKIALKQHSTHAKGIFATAPIQQGECIIIFTGPRLTYEEVDQNDYHLQIGENEYLGPSGDLDDYINHSCAPNAAFANGLTLVAIQDITPGEEITWDYSTAIDEPDFIGFPCYCGASVCRNLVQSYRHLSAQEKSRLYPMLLPYLKEKYAESHLKAVVRCELSLV